MSVNGVNSNNIISENYTANTTVKDKADKTTKQENAESNAQGAIYEKAKLSDEDRKKIVNQLKADMEKREQQLTSLVKDMMSKQTNAFGVANNMSIWQFLAKGDFEVDPEVQKKAQEDISEDGYWGVKQTSDRIVDFAKALAGDDTKALEKMKEAFLKGFKQAEKAWGGKLPEISQKTYDAVVDKFDKLINPSDTENTTPENGSSTEEAVEN